MPGEPSFWTVSLAVQSQYLCLICSWEMMRTSSFNDCGADLNRRSIKVINKHTLGSILTCYICPDFESVAGKQNVVVNEY